MQLVESVLLAHNWRKWLPVILVVVTLVAAIQIGRQVPMMGLGSGKSILILPAIVFLPVVWRLIPPPRAFNALCVCLVLMPLGISLGWQILTMIPGLNALPFFGQVLLVMALVFLTQVAMRRVRLPAASGIWLAMLIFVLGGAVALIGTTADSYNWWGKVCLLSLITLYVTVTVVHSLDQAERLLSAMVTGMIVFGLGMYVLLRSGIGVRAGPDTNWELAVGRLGGGLSWGFDVGFGIDLAVGSNAPQLGEYVAIGLAISFAYALGARSRLSRLGAMVSVALLSAILISALARGAMIGVVAAVVVIIAANLVWPGSHRGLLLLRLLLLLMLVLLVAILATQWRIEIDPTGGDIRSRMMSFRDIMSSISVVTRLMVWRAAWAMVQRYPFGYGFSGAFMPGGFNNPHNVYLWMLQGSGWIGFFGFLLALGGLAAVCLRGLSQPEPRRRVLSTAALGVLVAVLTQGIASVVFATPQITGAFWAVMGASLAVIGNRPRSSI